jgi:exodeoxyribonuclease VII large subunit
MSELHSFFGQMAAPGTSLSVSDLTQQLKVTVEANPSFRSVWVEGEVASLSRAASGLFFTLRDPEDGTTLRAVVWRSLQARLTAEPVVGEQVTVLGSLRLYPRQSQYQLQVVQVLPGGEGLAALRRQQLQRRLAAEGWFDRSRPLPQFLEMLAVVTSPQAAAWGDIQRTLNRRHPGLRVLLSPATVQGDQAPGSIVAAIDRVVADGRAQVLLISRGGGASTDLACFDDERVVTAIATCPIPVITGIGHQRDESLADLAADVCAHTPTAAAEQAVMGLGDLWQQQQQLRVAIAAALAQRFTLAQQQSHALKSRLQRLRLDRDLDQAQQHLQWQRQQLITLLRQQIYQAHQQCDRLGQQLTALDPEAVLRRGYALVRRAASATDADAAASPVVIRADTLNLGDRIQIQLGQGSVDAEVTGIQPSEAGDQPRSQSSPATPDP